MRLGAALFDGSNGSDGGWASIGEKAFRFKRPADLLGHGVIFVTNHPYAVHFDLHKYLPHIKHNQFFRTKIMSILSNLGMYEDTHSREQLTEAAGGILKCAGEYLSMILPDKMLKDTAEQSIVNFYFDDRERAMPARTDLIETIGINAWQQASHINNRTWEPGIKKGKAIANRSRHAYHVLSSRTPTGVHKLYGGCRVDEAVTADSPSFYKVEIDWKNSPNNEISAFGSGFHPVAPQMREWVSQPELVMLAELNSESLIKITQVVEFSEWKPAVNLPEPLTRSEYVFSLSCGLVAESFFWAACRDIFFKKTRSKILSIPACWLHSVDRGYSLANAFRIKELVPSVNVSSYAEGHVGLQFFDFMEEEISAAIAALGMTAFVRGSQDV